MVSIEKLQSHETKIPTPGTLSHLDYLALSEAHGDEQQELSDFLSATQATRSLGLLIKHLRTFRPIRSPYIDFDSRSFNGSRPGQPRFVGSIYRDPHKLDSGYMVLIGEQVTDESEETLSYSAFIPTHFDLSHDPSRPAEAVFSYLEDGKTKKAVYNQKANPCYDEHDPRVLYGVIQQSAKDFLNILGYKAGELPQPTPLEFQANPVVWHPDYLSDDPDEFLN